MIYLGDDVEICFTEGGDCAVKYQDEQVGGILEIEIKLQPDTQKRVCKLFPCTDKKAYSLQARFASEIVKAGFSVIWVTKDLLSGMTLSYPAPFFKDNTM